MTQPSWQQVYDADTWQTDLARFFGDAEGEKVFQGYAGIAEDILHPRHGETNGFNVALPSYTDLDLIAKTGAKWVRIAYEGEWIKNDNYSGVKDIVDYAHKAGLKVLAVAMGVPGGVRGFPSDTSTQQAFIDYAVALCDNGVDVLEHWNEPNGNQFTNNDPDVSLYARNQASVFNAVKAKHPNVPVISGGTTPAPSPNDPATWDAKCKMTSTFQVARDGWAHHPYDYTGKSPLADPIAWNSFAQTLNVAGGNLGMDGYITEVGSPSGGGTAGDGTPYTETRQTQWFDWYCAGMDLWTAQHNFTPKLVIWHTLRDYAALQGPEAHFGIYHEDGTPKPVTAHFLARMEARQT